MFITPLKCKTISVPLFNYCMCRSLLFVHNTDHRKYSVTKTEKRNRYNRHWYKNADIFWLESHTIKFKQKNVKQGNSGYPWEKKVPKISASRMTARLNKEREAKKHCYSFWSQMRTLLLSCLKFLEKTQLVVEEPVN